MRCGRCGREVADWELTRYGCVRCEGEGADPDHGLEYYDMMGFWSDEVPREAD
jgi:DNA-directed RNA polymerase subunit RPC12/RpoP